MRKIDLVIKNGIIITQDPLDTIMYKGGIAVHESKIIEINDTEKIAATYRGSREIDASGMAILPGFVNTHFHFSQNFMKGTQDNLNFLDWIDKISFPRIKVAIDGYRKGLPDINMLSALHAGIDLLSSGITCTTNMDWGIAPSILEIYKKLGLRVTNILTFTDIDTWTPKEAIIEESELFTLASEFIQACADDDRTEFAYGIACANSCSEKMIRKVRKHATEHKKRIHLHLAESQYEYEHFRKEKKMSSTQYLEEAGLWDSDVWVAHGIWLDDNDIDILAQYQVGVAHTPKCNMKIACGVTPVVKMLEKGVDVGLGIDSCAVSDNTDYFEAMRAMLFLQRITNMDANIIHAEDALKMATIGGAKILGRDHEIGSLEKGKQADMVFINLNDLNLRPYNKLINNLVYAANSSNIARVMIGGETVVEKGKFTRFDKDAIIDSTEQKIAGIYRKAGIELPDYFMIRDYFQ
jgi:5-methylthioadenosine/S-adenosylhomocysteine deaminase